MHAYIYILHMFAFLPLCIHNILFSFLKQENTPSFPFKKKHSFLKRFYCFKMCYTIHYGPIV